MWTWQLWCSLVRETNKGTLYLDILITFGLSGVNNLLQSFLDLFSAVYSTGRAPSCCLLELCLRDQTCIFQEKQQVMLCIRYIYEMVFKISHTHIYITYTLGDEVVSSLWKCLPYLCLYLKVCIFNLLPIVTYIVR